MTETESKPCQTIHRRKPVECTLKISTQVPGISKHAELLMVNANGGLLYVCGLDTRTQMYMYMHHADRPRVLTHRQWAQPNDQSTKGQAKPCLTKSWYWTYARQYNSNNREYKYHASTQVPRCYVLLLWVCGWRVLRVSTQPTLPCGSVWFWFARTRRDGLLPIVWSTLCDWGPARGKGTALWLAPKRFNRSVLFKFSAGTHLWVEAQWK